MQKKKRKKKKRVKEGRQQHGAKQGNWLRNVFRALTEGYQSEPKGLEIFFNSLSCKVQFLLVF